MLAYTMDRELAFDEIGFLAGSTTRVRLLSVLGESGPVEKGELRERFDVSRTTLKRNLDDLVDRGWVCEEQGNEYRLTTAGSMVEERLDQLVSAVDLAVEFKPFLEWVDPKAFDLDPAALSTADLTVAEPPNPYAPVNEHVNGLRETDSFRGCLSVVGRDAVEEVHRRLDEVDDPWELVVTEAVLETLRSDPIFDGQFDDLRAHDGLEIYVYDGEIPFFVGLFDDFVQIGVEDDDGMPRALVEAGDERVREWAEEFYEGYRERAELLG